LQYKVLCFRLAGRSLDERHTNEQPSAILPVAMSIVALALVLGHVAVYGIVMRPTRGPGALFQLSWCQVPIVAFFAIKWLPAIRDRH